jgi:8-oxo-dGTP pyrophosphatase MutT (NUDIX family)
MPIAPLRPAATVVVAREHSQNGAFEVLMVRRNDNVAFMAGAYVFPGGRVEAADIERAEHERHAFTPGSPLTAFQIAGARELEEEASVRVAPQSLVPIAHWITPEIETRRYDTRFFLARMPEGQQARHDEGETTELAWLTPVDAIERCLRGEIMLPPPTWTTLKRMQRHRTIEELFSWAQSVAVIPVVQPRFLKTEDQTLLTLPGDPTYPTIEGWDVPEDTRFRLQDGRWRPVKT